ncbi:Methyltransferase domain-containing protein [Nitrosomonas eutropha]|uniref:class I SAM-dependent methyltransferase n=1 Tax=Nitrosomonas eutropha TaxID=916 RepID=UPI0008886C24|nr:class I SAM-dependent methyltransferase [Nitrosomonas eutropha]SCX11222.1 Methyltransferase domain-containing protein [Nitrosomonas eutropha]
MEQDLLKQIESTRLKFSRVVREYKKEHGSYIDTAPLLKQNHIEECKVFCSRLDMLSSGMFNGHGNWAEIGVDQANFSKEIMIRVNPARLHLIDIDTSRIVMNNIQNDVISGRCIIHSGNSAEIISAFDDEYFDAIYIDGDHYYDGVKRDINASMIKVKRGGFIIFNDYSAWSPGSMSKCGVMKAANEFILKYDWSVVALSLQGAGYFDLAIKRPLI